MHGVFVRVKHKSLPILIAAVEKCAALVARGPVPREAGLARDRPSPYGAFMFIFIVVRGPVPRDASVV